MFQLRVGDKLPNSIPMRLNLNNQTNNNLENHFFYFLFLETNCNVCKKLLSSFDSLQLSSPKSFFIINENESDSDKQIRKYILQDNYIYLKDKRVFDKLGIKTVPQLLIIDRSNKIIYRDAIENYDKLETVIKDFS